MKKSDYIVGDRILFEGDMPRYGIVNRTCGTITNIECDEDGEPAALVVELDKPVPGGRWLALYLGDIAETREITVH